MPRTQRFGLGLTLLNLVLLALILLSQATKTVGAVTYPETVLFRMADPHAGPIIKMTDAANGPALGLSDGINGGNGGVSLYARDTASFVRVVDNTGHTQMIKP